MKVVPVILLAMTVYLYACEDPAANKVKAVITDSSTASNSRSEITPKGEALAVSPENSKVLFTGSKVTGRHEGGFNSFRGLIDLVKDSPMESAVQIDVDAASVFTDADGLTKHLQTGDFFDVAKYPKATFTSIQIVSDDSAGTGNYKVTGDLELRGIRKRVTFPATITVTEDEVKVDAEFSINRKDFGILYAGKADDLIRDNVVIRFDFYAPRKRA